MNYLAHLFLSYDDEDWLIGNFIGDHLTPYQYRELSESLQKGVDLHRYIDQYMDDHPAARLSKKILYPQFSKYAPVVLDVYADFFLSKHFAAFHSNQTLTQFCSDIYSILERRQEEMPTGIRKSLPRMIEARWLENYGMKEGLLRTFLGLQRRAKFEVDFSVAVEVLEQNIEELDGFFWKYFPDIIEAVYNKKKNLSYSG